LHTNGAEVAMRRMLVPALLAVSLMAVASTWAAQPTPGLPSRLRVLVSTDEMPEMFSFDQKGAPGLERELVEGFCRLHGLALEIVPVKDFDTIIPLLLRGEGDLITGIVDTQERRTKVAFTSEVFPVRHMAVTRRPGAPARTVGELRERRVGTIPGTTWEQAVIEAGVPRAKRVAFRDGELMLAGLRRGDVDAVVMTVFDFALAKKHDRELVAGPFVGAAASAAIGLRPQDRALREALNGYLVGMRQARQTLMFKYLSEEALTLIAEARRE
jgi:ABC-type amino acid transport substrate-binding protein